MLFFLTVIFETSVFAIEFKSTNTPVALIELYSSEGCSSCPPAEAQMAKLTNHPDLWAKFVPINFHVDYWNRLGWTDPYSNETFTDRQHDYARLWKVTSVYTPAFVLNAESVGHAFDAQSLKPVQKSDSLPQITVAAVKVKEEYSVSVNLGNLNSKKEYQVYVALLGNGLVSNVNAGENKGKTLIQNFVALKFENKTFTGKAVQFEIKLPEKSKASKYSIVAWLTERNQMRPVQAVGGYL